MSATRTQLTIEDLEQIPDDGMHREILRGELILLPPPRYKHTKIAMRLFLSLNTFVVSRKLGEVLFEGGFRLFHDERTYLQPDVSFVSTQQAAAIDPEDYAAGTPEVAFEIISPSERAGYIEAKNRAYFEVGAKAVVLVFPESRQVRVMYPGGRQRSFVDGETLSLPEILPGWEIPVAEIFGR
ncbi:MAG: Uma2 family endonuclease [Candidatus Solibacter usitatus]|nr:Uma2 family endonuclease [Candidatus Solibacter usitatus]